MKSTLSSLTFNLSRRWLSETDLCFGLGLVGALACFVALNYVALTVFCDQGSLVPAIWPGAGVVLAVLRLVKPRWWGPVLGCAAAAIVLARVAVGQALSLSVCLGVVHCLESALAAWLFVRCVGPHGDLCSMRQALAFLLGPVLVAPAVGGLVAAESLHFAAAEPEGTAWLRWWAANASGMLLVAPLGIMLGRLRHSPLPRPASVMESVLLLVVGLGCAQFAFSTTELEQIQEFHRPFLVIVVLYWASLRLHPWMTSGMVLGIASIALWNTYMGRGPLVLTAVPAGDPILGANAFIIAIGSVALLVTAVASENRQTIARLNETSRRLEELSNRDPLTHLLNRRSFEQSLKTYWHHAQRYHRALTCVMLDLDYFKRLNDTHGHPAGDDALRMVAKWIAAAIRQSDCACRYGGEEFCVVLPETDEQGGAVWAERARRAIAEMPIPAARGTLPITASFGVAQLMDQMSWQQLLDAADQALLVAKQSGRNRVITSSALRDRQAPFEKAMLHPLDEVSARDVMSTLVLLLRDDQTVEVAVRMFFELRIGSAPVVNREGKLVGMVSEHDLLTLPPTSDAWRIPLAEVMRTHVASFDEHQKVMAVLDFLRRTAMRQIVVVSQGRPTGLISRSTILRWLHNWHQGRFGLNPRGEHESAHSTRERSVVAAAALRRRAEELETQLRVNEESSTYAVVAEVTRIQRLLDDLLSLSYSGTNPSVQPLGSHEG